MAFVMNTDNSIRRL